MSKVVIKRDGSKEFLDISKISEALLKAHDYDVAELSVLLSKIEAKVFALKSDEIEIKIIQNIVENVLMGSKYKDVARKFIEYRHQRDVIREKQSKLMVDVEDFIKQNNKDLTNENANKDSKVVSSHRDLLAGILSKHLATTQILPQELVKWHQDGYGHIHDLDYIVSPLLNCCLVNYPDMLENGFVMGNASIEKPQSIGVACAVLSQVVLGVSSSSYGGQTISHIDRYLEPYVQLSYNKLKTKQEKYNLPEQYIEDSINKEVYDAMEAFLYECNTLTSCNG